MNTIILSDRVMANLAIIHPELAESDLEVINYFLQKNIITLFEDKFTFCNDSESLETQKELECQIKLENNTLIIQLNGNLYSIKKQNEKELVMQNNKGKIFFRISLEDNTLTNFLIEEKEEEKSYTCQRVSTSIEECYEYHKTIVTPEQRIYSKTLRAIPRKRRNHIHYKISALEEKNTKKIFQKKTKYKDIKIGDPLYYTKGMYLKTIFDHLEEQSIKSTYIRKLAPSFN